MGGKGRSGRDFDGSLDGDRSGNLDVAGVEVVRSPTTRSKEMIALLGGGREVGGGCEDWGDGEERRRVQGVVRRRAFWIEGWIRRRDHVRSGDQDILIW